MALLAYFMLGFNIPYISFSFLVHFMLGINISYKATLPARRPVNLWLIFQWDFMGGKLQQDFT